MLVLTRGIHEHLQIGEGSDASIVTVLEIRTRTVRLGITTGKHIRVLRGELVEALEEEGEE